MPPMLRGDSASATNSSSSGLAATGVGGPGAAVRAGAGADECVGGYGFACGALRLPLSIAWTPNIANATTTAHTKPTPAITHTDRHGRDSTSEPGSYSDQACSGTAAVACGQLAGDSDTPVHHLEQAGNPSRDVLVGQAEPLNDCVELAVMRRL